MDLSLYKVGVIRDLEGCGNSKAKNGKAYKVCSVQIDPDCPEDLVTVVTSASNVRQGSRIVVAPIGSTILTDEGESMTVQKATVGGVISEGLFCDSIMLGWSGGGKGVAAQLPYRFEIGSSPPSSKPRKEEEEKPEEPVIKPAEGLYEKKLTKEEKKKLAEERRKAKRAAKEASKLEAESEKVDTVL
mmetsp:Transcript_63531/g.74398  ORF Transcript_63531/g.74398 Transcript_63531/m.74398 type:complete len:187 (+) Transcript_63531:27-587(+)